MKRARRRGFPVKLTKQRWLLVRMAAIYLDSKDKLGDEARRAFALIPDYDPGVRGVKTLRLQAAHVEGMRQLLAAASEFFYRHYGVRQYASTDGRAFKIAAERLAEIDLVTQLGDVARHPEMVA